MTPEVFATAIRQLCQAFGGSVTSWGRTEAHNRAVGGVAGSPHTWWVGADIVWDAVPHPTTIEEYAGALGLHCLWEGTHTHVQPKGWINHENG